METGGYNFDYQAAMAAGAQALTAGAGIVYQGEADKQNRKLFRETRDLQRQWALEDYERILQDSSPAAQVERLKEAKLNPNLVYGSGNVQTGVTSMPNYNNTSMPYRQTVMPDLAMLNVLGSYWDVVQKKAEVNKTKAEANKANADANKANSETEGQNLQNQFDTVTFDIRKDLLENNNYKVLQEVNKLDHDIINGDLLTQKQLTLNDEQINSIIQARFVQWEELELNRSQIGAQIRQGFMRAEAELKNADAASTNAAANFIRAKSEVVRNSKLNELTDFQIGQAALTFQEMYDLAGVSESSKKSQLELEEQIADEKKLSRFRFNASRLHRLTGLSFDDFRSIVPFAPSIIKALK